MHCVALPFKLAFALVPPSEYYGGWACFWVALFFIAVVTVCIQDLAMLFGCALGLKDEVTAITIVALGTSLPDTFASKTAAVSDDTADAAIGNITGSNSVNVFLGLGLPWMIAAIKWELYGPNKAWRERYGESGVEGWDSTAPKLGEDKFGFAVPAGSLGFSVTIFTVCSVICFVILYLRRITVGFELGGPPDSAKWTALLFVGMWFFYILMSSLEAYGHL
jgi:solute carrier family 8 (sodium/calcium exchanger)